MTDDYATDHTNDDSKPPIRRLRQLTLEVDAQTCLAFEARLLLEATDKAAEVPSLTTVLAQFVEHAMRQAIEVTDQSERRIVLPAEAVKEPRVRRIIT